MSETVRTTATAGRAVANAVRTAWYHLETGWQSVLLGFVVVSMVTLLEVRIPW
jgi:hypothetical protein